MPDAPPIAQAAAGANPVIIDLNASGVDPAEVIRRCKSAPNPPRIIAYLSHVQHELAEAAQQAGADCVMPHPNSARSCRTYYKDHRWSSAAAQTRPQAKESRGIGMVSSD